jgi:hypothetical protein
VCIRAYFDDFKGKRDGQKGNVYINELSMLLGRRSEQGSPAPPRCVLKTFGGDMNIDDFRNMNNKIKLLYPPCDHRKSVCEEVDAHMVQKVPGTFPSTMIS